MSDNYSLCDLRHVLSVTAAALAILVARDDFPRPCLQLPGDKTVNILGPSIGYRLYEAEAIQEWKRRIQAQGQTPQKLAGWTREGYNPPRKDTAGTRPNRRKAVEDTDGYNIERPLNELDEDFDNDAAAQWLAANGH